jgi:hypothetical protein
VPPAHALIARTVQQALIETSKCPKTPEPCGFPGPFFFASSVPFCGILILFIPFLMG